MISVGLRLTMDVPVCLFFQQGRCAYGPACRFLHTTTSTAGSVFNPALGQHHQVPLSTVAHSQAGSRRGNNRGRRHSLGSSRRASRQGPAEPAFHERTWQELPQVRWRRLECAHACSFPCTHLCTAHLRAHACICC